MYLKVEEITKNNIAKKKAKKKKTQKQTRSKFIWKLNCRLLRYNYKLKTSLIPKYLCMQYTKILTNYSLTANIFVSTHIFLFIWVKYFFYCQHFFFHLLFI
uniref:Transmembrane protein n=1 Tax=Octopus bimaculoides TaxID=37653 RepID=A0A0L8GWF9_OCTBM